ncbi:unnamed protein product, partial [Urochloa humidicola]
LPPPSRCGKGLALQLFEKKERSCAAGKPEEAHHLRTAMEPTGVTERLLNRTVLITGATGFIAKLLVEKIMRLQPQVKRLYLLVRAGDQ